MLGGIRTRFREHNRGNCPRPPQVGLANFAGHLSTKIQSTGEGSGLNNYVQNLFDKNLTWDENGTAAVECNKASATVYYWYREALDASPNIETPGVPRWWIVCYLLLAWIIVVYFTSLFPYAVLTIFFVRGITLPGSTDGIIHMYKPKLEKLLDPTVWLDAATQVFYSFGLAFGSLIAFGSYNPPNNNCVRDVLLVSVCNALTAIYASVGDQSPRGGPHRRLQPELYPGVLQGGAAEGTGLAFIVFTQAILKLTPAPFWSIIFFLMLLSLGLGSQIGIMEGMLCTIFDIDIFKRVSKPVLTGIVCTFCFLVGLIFTTGAGEYWLKMFDSFAGTIGLVVVALLEMVSVIYIYGHERVVKTPYPSWVLGVAVVMILAGVLPIPVVFLLRRFQCLTFDVDIHQGSIRRIETTVSTKEMMSDQDVKYNFFTIMV
ncbi:Transporter [Operophtera brumata]|uniref:Transporter n=1 Tax=Operophtera brumata TaxID=104452 RepID=A0A0L7KT94_OPEBR|nr:Transporter [Operophtera brumata]